MPGSPGQWRWWPFWIGQWSMNLLICWLTAFIFLSLASHWGSFTQYPRSVLRRSKLSWRVVLIWRCHGKQFMQHRKAWNFTPYWSILSMSFFWYLFWLGDFLHCCHAYAVWPWNFLSWLSAVFGLSPSLSVSFAQGRSEANLISKQSWLANSRVRMLKKHVAWWFAPCIIWQ